MCGTRVSRGVLTSPRPGAMTPARGRAQPTDFKEEVAAVRQYRDKLEADKNYQAAMALAMEQARAAGHLIECGCCFDEFPFERMVQCDQGDLFCTSCLKRSAPSGRVENDGSRPV